MSASGDLVRVRPGVCGAGYAFRVYSLGVCGFGRPIVIGAGPGPTYWTTDVERVTDSNRCPGCGFYACRCEAPR